MPEDVRSVQQKPEAAAASSHADFEHDFEELMRGHLDDCVSFDSCSTPRTLEDGDEDSDHLVRRRMRSGLDDVDGDDLAESSARRQSRILSRWAARQAQEMITTIERRNRESELMALAGLHTVSMLDSSFLRESQSPSSRRQGNVERPGTQALATLQMWRELEDDERNRTRERVRERLRRQRRTGETNGNVSTMGTLETLQSESQGSVEDASGSENDFGPWSNDQMSPRNEQDHNSSSREQSPDLGDAERERVSQTVHGLMENGISEHSSNLPHTQRNNSPRAEWLGESERERVRVIREWMQMTSQQRSSHVGRRDGHTAELGAPVDRVQEGMVVERDENQTEHVRRDRLRLRGRQALVDLLVRIERERQRELQGLVEHRAVSDFAHRSRIQSLLRGRFLRSERPVVEERPPTMDTGELVLLRQRHSVSGLREGFLSRSANVVHGQGSSHSDDDTSNDTTSLIRNDPTQTTISQGAHSVSEQLQSMVEDTSQPSSQNRSLEYDTAIENLGQEQTTYPGEEWLDRLTDNVRENWQSLNYARLNEWRDGNAEATVGNLPMSMNNPRPGRNQDEDEHHSQVPEVRREGSSQEAVEGWAEVPSDPRRTNRSSPSRRYNTFNPPDDHNVYSIELRELLSRRSVSNLLHSEFRESLDQLIESYVERRGHAPIDWDLHRNLPIVSPASPVQDQDELRDEQNENYQGGMNRSSLVLPSPPIPPPRPLWHRDSHHISMSRHGVHRSELEWEMINDLRADMARLQQGMNLMQRMLEACMDMQLELQRSVRQEVSAALNLSAGSDAETSATGSKWGPVKKGTCCVCCDSQIDSLLYRCGHMCTCSQCANELIRTGGKCPLCRAPIVKVIRAYSIE